MTTQLKALIYTETADANGNVTLKKVTTTRWLTPAMAAEQLGLSDKTVYRLIEAGRIPAHRHGFSIRISVDDFLEYQMNSRHAEYERP